MCCVVLVLSGMVLVAMARLLAGAVLLLLLLRYGDPVSPLPAGINLSSSRPLHQQCSVAVVDPWNVAQHCVGGILDDVWCCCLYGGCVGLHNLHDHQRNDATHHQEQQKHDAPAQHNTGRQWCMQCNQPITLRTCTSCKADIIPGLSQHLAVSCLVALPCAPWTGTGFTHGQPGYPQVAVLL